MRFFLPRNVTGQDPLGSKFLLPAVEENSSKHEVDTELRDSFHHQRKKASLSFLEQRGHYKKKIG